MVALYIKDRTVRLCQTALTLQSTKPLANTNVRRSEHGCACAIRIRSAVRTANGVPSFPTGKELLAFHQREAPNFLRPSSWAL